MQVPILKQGPHLIATVQSALTDADLVQLRDAIVEQVGRTRARGVIIDVTALDVVDSFATATMRAVENNGGKGIIVEARDDGPGIPQPQRALEDGYSTSGRLGLGLPGVKRLMDEFRLETAPGRGTRVVVHKWVR